MSQTAAHADYVIVGAGSAGCVLANRLSQDPAVSVLLIEAGGRDNHPMIHMPKGLPKVISNLRYIWPYMTQGEAASNDAAEAWARGKVLGGSSAVNGMVYVRGEAADFDALAGLTSQDWSWNRIGQAYKAMENHKLGAAPTRGDRGPLHISMPTLRTRLTRAVAQAGVAMGLTLLEDVNDSDDAERVGYLPRTIYKGRRESAARAFLQPAARRPNLKVVTGVSVDRVVFDGRRAVGLAGARAGAPVAYGARREVILSAGALASPAILQRSGVGPAAHLARLDIPVVQNSLEVGENLREHRGLVMQWRVRDEVSQNRQLSGSRLIRNAIRYGLDRGGPLSGAAYELGAWFKTRPALDRPDAQMLIAPHTFDYSATSLRVEPFGGLNCVIYRLRPESMGSVRLTSREPADLPAIIPNYASAEADRNALPDLIRYARRYMAQQPLADLIVEETRPGSAHVTDEELAEAHRKFGYTSYHACGTCRMGADAASVVDSQLKVRGVEGLRVVDTSVFPFILSGNTNGPAMAVAWRAAELILETA